MVVVVLGYLIWYRVALGWLICQKVISKMVVVIVVVLGCLIWCLVNLGCLIYPKIKSSPVDGGVVVFFFTDYNTTLGLC